MAWEESGEAEDDVEFITGTVFSIHKTNIEEKRCTL